MSQLVKKYKNPSGRLPRVQRVILPDKTYGYVPVNKNNSVIDGAYDDKGRIKVYQNKDLSGTPKWMRLDRDQKPVGIQRRPDSHDEAVERDRKVDEYVQQTVGSSDNWTPWGQVGLLARYTLGNTMRYLPSFVTTPLEQFKYLTPGYYIDKATNGEAYRMAPGTMFMLDLLSAPTTTRAAFRTADAVSQPIARYAGNTSAGRFLQNTGRTIQGAFNDWKQDAFNNRGPSTRVPGEGTLYSSIVPLRRSDALARTTEGSTHLGPGESWYNLSDLLDTYVAGGNALSLIPSVFQRFSRPQAPQIGIDAYGTQAIRLPDNVARSIFGGQSISNAVEPGFTPVRTAEGEGALLVNDTHFIPTYELLTEGTGSIPTPREIPGEVQGFPLDEVSRVIPKHIFDELLRRGEFNVGYIESPENAIVYGRPRQLSLLTDILNQYSKGVGSFVPQTFTGRGAPLEEYLTQQGFNSAEILDIDNIFPIDHKVLPDDVTEILNRYR